MSNSDLVRKYFSAYENKDRKAVESLRRFDLDNETETIRNYHSPM